MCQFLTVSHWLSLKDKGDLGNVQVMCFNDSMRHSFHPAMNQIVIFLITSWGVLRNCRSSDLLALC